MSYPSYSQKKSKKKLDENKSSALNNLKQIENTGIFDVSFFTKAHPSNKVSIDPETLAQAFKIIDPYNNQNTHSRNYSTNKPENNDSKTNKPENYSRYKMNFSELKRRIQIINPNFPINELALFTGGKPEIMYKELYELLQDNEINDDLDPLDEAVGLLLDIEGNLDLEKFKGISQALGYPTLEKKDLEILKECMDIDGDGKINRSDFNELFKFIQQRKKKLE